MNPYTLLNRKLHYSLDDDDINLVRRAIGQAELTLTEPDIIHDIHQGDRRPLMTLLLASLPNLTGIRAHVPLGDYYLATVLQQAIDHQEREVPGPLNQLRELAVFAEVPIATEAPLEDSLEIPQVPLRLDDLWPVLFFKVPMNATSNRNHGASYINNLLLTTLRMSRCEPADVQARITLPESLSSFSIYLDDQLNHFHIMDGQGYFFLGRRFPFKISNPDIWDVLQKHQENIQYLDIFRTRNRVNPDLGHLKSLQSFSQLRDLRIQLPVLTGVDRFSIPDHTKPRLKDTLPEFVKGFLL
ncbi:hypothetical protein BDV12DRAFT_195835 [Aspergillus spectabilis]